jgi:hypothetical protein
LLPYEVPFPAETLYSFDVDVKNKGRKEESKERKKEKKRKEARKERRKRKE